MLYYRRYEEALALKTPADLVIMTDDGTQGDEVLARLNPASRARMKFWRNGLDLDRLQPATRGRARAPRAATSAAGDGAFVMLTASRLATWKRVDRAIRALPKIAIVGAGCAARRRRRRRGARAARSARARAARERRTCDSSAPCRRRDVMRYMHAADVFLAIADLSNVGNPLLEAMACGMCIVAVDAGDTRDLISDGKTGRLVDNSNRSGIAKPLEERLADLLVTLAGDAPQRARLAAGAAAYARRALLDVGPAHGGRGRGRDAAARCRGAPIPVSAAADTLAVTDTITRCSILRRRASRPRGSFLGHVNVVMADVRARWRAGVR